MTERGEGFSLSSDSEFWSEKTHTLLEGADSDTQLVLFEIPEHDRVSSLHECPDCEGPVREDLLIYSAADEGIIAASAATGYRCDKDESEWFDPVTAASLMRGAAVVMEDRNHSKFADELRRQADHLALTGS